VYCALPMTVMDIDVGFSCQATCWLTLISVSVERLNILEEAFPLSAEGGENCIRGSTLPVTTDTFSFPNGRSGLFPFLCFGGGGHHAEAKMGEGVPCINRR
jgi:hypothetical protein